VPYGESFTWKALATGEVDLCVGHFANAPQSHFRQKLFDDDMVCLVRQGHPRVKGRLSLERFLELEHLLIAPFGGTEGSVDVLLRERGLERKVVLWVPTFTLAPLIAARSDLIATVPRRIAEAFTEVLPLQLLPPPLPVPGFTFSQLWHRRSEADPAHQWLRRFIFTTGSPAT
jgi:DNA-binding transcriptional LysR family regulator